MTKIRKKAFAHCIEEYLLDPASFEQERFDASLYTICRQSVPGAEASAGTRPQQRDVLQGLCFSEHIDMVMFLLAHAFATLEDNTTREEFAAAIARAMQSFAEPLADDALACYPYPHFLLHGIACPTLDRVVDRLRANGRIIHETLADRARFMAVHGGPVALDHGISLRMEEGSVEDYLGICCYLVRSDETQPHGTDTTFIAKACFFLDTSEKILYVLTVQGQRVLAGQKKRSRDYARLAAKLGMDPRAYVLARVCAMAAAEQYVKVRVVTPRCHPMSIDRHEGFMARYEPVIRQAGIVEENGCYLERTLP
ncbi:hypothetical protein [Desulfolithobacter sp.]